ncbi:MAG: nicotinate-nucleotide adenylyltransferase [Anaerolineae bacterium]|nr:MAG: nicotinate-nucleotide adenylyltransferase [Anaerolineae bacterium]
MIGVFGGTFDPPHIGHLVLADEARFEMGLSKVLWVVTGEPPHKPDRPIIPVKHRLRMVELAIQNDPAFELSRLEVDRPGPHYAVDTLAELAEARPDDERAYVMGKDSLRDLPAWRSPERFVQLSKAIVVLNRPDVEANLEQLDTKLPGLADKVHFLEVPVVDVASRDIRRRVASGKPYRYLVARAVADYIAEHDLYR